MHLFAHNGELDGIWDEMPLRAGSFHPVGQTDSEYAFCVLLDRLSAPWRRYISPPTLSERLAIVAETAAEFRRLGPANFLYSDGDVLFAHSHKRHWDEGGGHFSEARPPGLSVATHRELSVKGLKVEAPTDETDVLYVASVPLTSEGWSPVPEGAVIALQQGLEVARLTA
jgi:predicted glutamine amidotransferase